MQQLVAGIDSSTQSCKVVVCDAETGNVVRQGRATHPDGTSVHPDRWWKAVEPACEGGLLDGVSAIAVGGQQHGMVALDEDDEVVREALLWNDTRSSRDAQDLVSELGGPQEWVDQVGVVPVASFTVSKVRWLARCEPQSAERVARVVLPHDWLTGRFLQENGGFDGWTTDRGDASGTGYWSARTGEYREDIMKMALGRPFSGPRVLGPAERAGTTSAGMVVAAGTGDNMGAGLGLSLQPGDVVVSLGTSGTVFTTSDVAPADPSGTVAGFADATGTFLPLMCTLNAARVMTAAAAMLGVDLDRLDELALAAEPGAGGLTMLPYLDGERTPDLPEATGTIGGLTRANSTPENIARAAVEGMLLNLRGGIEALRGQGAEVERVLLIGGASASRAVHSVAASLFDVPVAVPEPGEYVGIGAARQAAWALSGADEPPEWPLRLASEPSQERPADSTTDAAEIVQRYASLQQTVHPK
ncbi:MAG: xylulokinase [Ornithinimicrobium sp.]